MTSNAMSGGGRQGNRWRIALWGGAGLLLSLPLIAMQFTREVAWTGFDFAVMGGLLALVCSGFELIVRLSRSITFRAGAGVAIIAGFLLIWVNGAVGFLGDETNPANLIFAGVLAVAVLGSALAGFRAAGMARALFATAAAQVLAGVIALTAGWSSPGNDGLYEVVMGTSVFAAFWALSAGLFLRAARDEALAATVA